MKERSMRRYTLVVVSILVLTMGLIAGCSDEEKLVTDRLSCDQPQECGEGGRENWVCSPEGLCYSIEEYCTMDSQCNGACIQHVCENGPLVTDGDGIITDGDEAACEYDCCNNADCNGSYICDLNTHTCIPDTTSGDCTTDNDCDPGYACIGSVCTEKIFTCSPGKVICCSSIAEYGPCDDMGDVAKEAILTCKADGRGYDVSMCPKFETCIDNLNNTVDCFPNNRCETSSDCDGSKTCQQNDDGNLRCTE